MVMDTRLGIMIFSIFPLCNCSYTKDTLPKITNEDFIKECVDIHNKLRSSVSPKASNMLKMSWDPDLAKTARAWAKRCEFKHNIYLDTAKMAHPTFNPVGENMWTGSLGQFTPTVAIQMWYDEVKNYDYQTQKCTGVCGHYTQVVWANSYKIGCAVQFCPKVKGFGALSNGAHFLCDYGPAGNYPTRPYKKGNACSDCRGEKCVKKLCENPNRDEVKGTNFHPVWEIFERNRKLSLTLTLGPLFIILFAIVVSLIKHYYPRQVTSEELKSKRNNTG
ncbi:glioma pathogenesis-related protein 1 isoform X1 [Monodelphis domestica]|uniref:glioma pathogenesis-related protein 1 isoform X1 n=2 Tax=Monodelphis domestica TaxID=13616 RepID=UPI0024E24C8B|nr:glioma pathogenesis-related protein 1 isoform X1 [Monodelphis domestica]